MECSLVNSIVRSPWNKDQLNVSKPYKTVPLRFMDENGCRAFNKGVFIGFNKGVFIGFFFIFWCLISKTVLSVSQLPAQSL